jgi:predicted TIM-barrel fold metal-dependent hydrolase
MPVPSFRLLVLIVILGVFGSRASSQERPVSDQEMILDQFRPKSQLRVKKNLLTQAKFPVVDVHTHFHFKLKQGAQGLDAYVKTMDRNQIAICVSLDGRLGDDWNDHESLLWKKYRDRFVIFGFIDWLGPGDPRDPLTWDCNQPDFGRRIEKKIRDAHRRGASGIKIFKALGLEVPNPDGTLARIDDPRWEPIWRTCGELGLPILIHTGDPAAFFERVDVQNERWEELHRHPEWSFHDERFPRREELFAALIRVIEKHPRTTFIGGHIVNCAEDLETVAAWLDEFPNLHVEVASRIGELGRQPYTARDFFLKYADRIMFGTDGPWPEQRLTAYWRFLETKDEYFPYSEKPFPPQGFWQIYGIYLPDDVLRKVYFENAASVIPGVRERLLPRYPELEPPQKGDKSVRNRKQPRPSDPLSQES